MLTFPHLTGEDAEAQRMQAVSETVPHGASVPSLLQPLPDLAVRMPSKPTLPTRGPARSAKHSALAPQELYPMSQIPTQSNLGCQGADWLLGNEFALKCFQSSFCEKDHSLSTSTKIELGFMGVGGQGTPWGDISGHMAPHLLSIT